MHLRKRRYLVVLLLIGMLSLAASTDRDIITVDFEYDNYGDWVVTGQTFGTGSADRSRS